MNLDQLWAGWRSEYVASVAPSGDAEEDDGCVLCRIADCGDPEEGNGIVWRDDCNLATLNAYPMQAATCWSCRSGTCRTWES